MRIGDGASMASCKLAVIRRLRLSRIILSVTSHKATLLAKHRRKLNRISAPTMSIQVARPSCTRVEQRLRILQITRVKPFREPAVDRSEQIAGLILLALIAPQPR